MEGKHIEVIARAVIIHEETILLCKPKDGDYYYFPGGHVEFDEDSATALKRELKEEVDADVAHARFIGVWENQFMQGNMQKHEVNILFEARLASPNIKNMEDHIESMWVPLTEFKEAWILPASLKEKVIQWMEDKQVFFGSEKDGKRIV
ncbi:MAG: hypothetical protein A3J54_00665 [Candidatus Ryanbacteria bacterium RIFCSPHIGHO2_02_FULL_45_13b]|uniref:Nudix hydrolase domain-containing protein n=1 Tax=Candidatus Ryanbacteria bacterium RIFCSPHIGHO2_02_FULL_45_13b TaxID=1802117 RepID=A0A1G2G3J0_9BACT|nr:MAG: hypothetical protein A3J54_00665 [Candidatus Ryanbacteria bacterium RIFCSPHIGHO2_02_FULL_45_13b]